MIISERPEYWILYESMNGWLTISGPYHEFERAADHIRGLKPGGYKIVQTVGSYKTQVELIPEVD